MAKKERYYNERTHAAVLAYQQAQTQDERNQLYREHLSPAFTKLAESLIRVYKFKHPRATDDELRDDCACYLFETIHKFNPEKCSNSFSYFNVVAKNFLIISVKREQIRTRREESVDTGAKYGGGSDQHMASLPKELWDLETPETRTLEQEGRDEMMGALERTTLKARRPHDKLLMEAIASLVADPSQVAGFKKSAVLSKLREMTGLEPQHLSLATTRMRYEWKKAKSSPAWMTSGSLA